MAELTSRFDDGTGAPLYRALSLTDDERHVLKGLAAKLAATESISARKAARSAVKRETYEAYCAACERHGVAAIQSGIWFRRIGSIIGEADEEPMPDVRRVGLDFREAPVLRSSLMKMLGVEA